MITSFVVRSEIYNCTFKNTNKVSIIIAVAIAGFQCHAIQN